MPKSSQYFIPDPFCAWDFPGYLGIWVIGYFSTVDFLLIDLTIFPSEWYAKQPRSKKERNIAMPRGASPKREREYKTLVKKFKGSGRYKGRAKEVASRIVNKQRSKAGETKGSKGRSRTKSHTRSRSTKPRTTRSHRGTTARR